VTIPHHIIIGALLIIHGIVRAGIGIIPAIQMPALFLHAALFSLALALPSLVGGFNLFKDGDSPHGIAFLAAFINLIDFPIGIMLSLYYFYYWYFKCGAPHPFRADGKAHKVEEVTSARTHAMQRVALVKEVTSLTGVKPTIGPNAKTLQQTAEALIETTDLDRATIESLTSRISNDTRYQQTLTETDKEKDQKRKNLFIIQCLAVAAVSIISIYFIRGISLINDLSAVANETGSIRMAEAAYYMEHARYPHNFESIEPIYPPANFDAIEQIEMGTQGQLHIQTKGIFGGTFLLTDSHLIFKFLGNACQYKSSININPRNW